ncbi:hypothetical protein FE257_009730 [Aspergillus nanangensis]|uniref:Uncharacterized protein n=1 Tax=Aspergillus nanangensis TaxID=2582783 RepID=A0AAD4GSG9_ASPNN|nr:hypothetical protein FE257_009730 [Aspergillus nanangensis]
MKFLFALFVLAVSVAADVESGNTVQAGCSQKGQFCNNGTFLCCGKLKCDTGANVCR